MKAWIVYNPYAGRFPSRPFVERAARTLRAAGWEISIRETGGPQDVGQLAAASAAEGCEALFVAGGDGTLGQAVQMLAGTDTALGVLPTGTANVFAQELGLARLGYTDWFALEEAAQALTAGRLARMDVGRCNGEIFLLWAGVGLDGHVTSRVEPRPRIAKNLAVPYYVTASFWAARDWHGLNLRVQVDEHVTSGQFIQVLVSNVQTYGGGLFQLSDQARVDDGLLNVWLFSGETTLDAIRQVVALLRGRHVNHPCIRELTGRKISLEAPFPVFWQLDGEGYPAARRFEIDVWPGALKVLLPERLPRPLFSQISQVV